MCVAPVVEFLGHRVDQHGVQPLQRHVQAISYFPPPQDVKQLQQFFGMVNFYRRFLSGIARTLQPLTDTLKGTPKTLEWPPGGTPPPFRPHLVTPRSTLHAATPHNTLLALTCTFSNTKQST